MDHGSIVKVLAFGGDCKTHHWGNSLLDLAYMAGKGVTAFDLCGIGIRTFYPTERR